MATIERGNIIDAASGAFAEFTKAGALANGDLNGVAEKGTLARDTTDGGLYQNTGTKAATIWTRLATVDDLESS
jgi:hypothetical protein